LLLQRHGHAPVVFLFVSRTWSALIIELARVCLSTRCSFVRHLRGNCKGYHGENSSLDGTELELYHVAGGGKFSTAWFRLFYQVSFQTFEIHWQLKHAFTCMKF
jgi:hypothetical protein